MYVPCSLDFTAVFLLLSLLSDGITNKRVSLLPVPSVFHAVKKVTSNGHAMARAHIILNHEQCH